MGHFPLTSLRWWDGDKKKPTNHKSPMLGLKLSSHSFLDSSIDDGLSSAPVYVIKTTDASTTVLRCSGEEDFIQIATIKWPGVVSTKEARKECNNPLLIKMKGCHWSRGQAFLRSESNSNSRKFTIPDYPHAMKWKRYGTTSYWCTTTAIKGPIATLDLPKGQPIRLAVYETLHDKFDPQGLSAYQGVSFLLLDYLIVTALLSVTDALAWTFLKKVGDVQGIATSHGADSGDQRLPYVPQFDHPYASVSGGRYKTRSETSLTSLTTTLSAFRHSSSYDSGMPTCVETDPSCSKRYSTSTIEECSKNYRASLHSNNPSASAEDVQYGGFLPFHKSVRTSSHSSRSILPLHPSPQFSEPPTRPRAGTSTSHYERSHLLDQPHRRSPLDIESRKCSASSEQLSILSDSTHCPSQFKSHRPFGLEQETGSSSSEQPPNVSTLAHSLRRSESRRGPLPQPPRGPGVGSTDSTPLAVNSSTEGPKRNIRSLPVTPVMEQDSRRTSVLEGNSRLQPHARTPPMTKESQEDLTQWVHDLTNPVRVLPAPPLSETVLFDLPPPAYDSIKFGKRNCIPAATPTDLST